MNAGPCTSRLNPTRRRSIGRLLATTWPFRSYSGATVPALQARWLPAPAQDPETALVRKERREIVARSIRALPERHREAVCLHYLMERSYDEIVEQLQVPAGTLKVWLYRGRHGLKREVERLGVTGSS